MNKYKDKFFSILGDSISTLAGFNPPESAVFYDWEKKCEAEIFSPSDTWWGKVISALGGRLLEDNAELCESAIFANTVRIFCLPNLAEESK